MSMGGQKSSSRNNENQATMSPIAIGLGNLFGLESGYKKGGLAFGTNLKGSNLFPQVFTPSDFESLGDLTNVLNPVRFDAEQIQNYGNQAMNTFGEAAATGLIDPARDLFGQLFNERIAGLQEQFGGFGLNANDTDFQAAALREAQLGSTQLADLAQNRRLQAAGSLPDLLNNILGLEGSARTAERSSTQAGQLYDLLASMGGMNTQASTLGSGKSLSFGANIV